MDSVNHKKEDSKMKRTSLFNAEAYWVAFSGVLLGFLAGCVSQEAILRTAPATTVQPVNLSSVINTKLREAEVSFTADGKTMYFNCQMRPGPAGNDICVSRLIGKPEDGRWTTPEIVAPGVISLTDTLEVEPLISADGKTLYFQSRNRPGGYGHGDIWYSENVDGVW